MSAIVDMARLAQRLARTFTVLVGIVTGLMAYSDDVAAQGRPIPTCVEGISLSPGQFCQYDSATGESFVFQAADGSLYVAVDAGAGLRMRFDVEASENSCRVPSRTRNSPPGFFGDCGCFGNTIREGVAEYRTGPAGCEAIAVGGRFTAETDLWNGLALAGGSDNWMISALPVARPESTLPDCSGEFPSDVTSCRVNGSDGLLLVAHYLDSGEREATRIAGSFLDRGGRCESVGWQFFGDFREYRYTGRSLYYRATNRCAFTGVLVGSNIADILDIPRGFSHGDAFSDFLSWIRTPFGSGVFYLNGREDRRDAQARATDTQSAATCSDDARRAAMAIPDLGSRTEALRELVAAQMFDGCLNAARGTAMEILDLGSRAEALGRVVDAQVAAGRLNDAQGTAMEILDYGSKTEALRRVVDAHVAGGCFDDGRNAATAIPDFASRTEALRRVVEAQLDGGCFSDAQSTAMAIPDFASRSEMLRRIDGLGQSGVSGHAACNCSGRR